MNSKTIEPKTKSSSPLTHLLAGATSGLVSCIALQPLDLLKTRIQQQAQNKSLMNALRTTLQNEGFLGLWRGTLATALRNCPGSGLYFLTLNEIRTRLKGKVANDTLNLGSGMAARVVFALEHRL
jgi:solute carrier family 25, member 38